MSNIFVALSGGVDSGVSALKLLERGETVRGLYMRHRFQPVLDVDESRIAVEKWGKETNLTVYSASVAGDLTKLDWTPAFFPLPIDAASALELAAFLGIELTILDVDAPFLGVVENFVDEYFAARTPNPCVLCNKTIKFGLLFDAARRLGADILATGHYVRKRRVADWVAELENVVKLEENATSEDGAVSKNETNEKGKSVFSEVVKIPDWLKRNDDAEFIERSPSPKDQSYFLYSIAAETLRRVEFPVGSFDKSQVRRFAQEKGLPVAARKDSQEVCFVPDKRRLEFIREIRESNPARWGDLPHDTTGNFLSLDGKIIGKHEGYEKFTVGQRKGLGMGFGERIFVQRVDPTARTVVLGPYEALAVDKICAVDANWQTPVPLNEDFRCEIKIRYRNESTLATVCAGPDGSITALPDEPRFGVAAGQSLVCYWNGRLLGGGRII